MTRLLDLPQEVWVRLLDFLSSPDSVALYATGSSLVILKLSKTLSSLSVGLVSAHSVLRFPNLRALEVKDESVALESLHLPSFPQLCRIELPKAIKIPAQIFSALSNLTHFKAALDSLDLFLETSKAPLASIHLLDGEYSEPKLSLLPPTTTYLNLYHIKHSIKLSAIQTPLPASITSLALPITLLNINMPHLGLPESLHSLWTISLPGIMSLEFVEKLPRGLQEFSCFMGRMSSEAVTSLPPNLKHLIGVSLADFSAGNIMNLPSKLELLQGDLLSRPLHSIDLLPSSLTYLSITHESVFSDENIGWIPKTVRGLAIPNGNLTGKSVASLPPHLEKLKITESRSQLEAYWAPSPEQPWNPFFLDPQYVAHLPLSLTEINAHVYQDIPNIFLERLPNSISSWISNPEKVERILNVLVDLREATLIDEVILMIQDMRTQLSRSILDPIVQRISFPRLNPVRLVIYTLFPQTLEYSNDITDASGKVSDTRIFMTRVQALYDMLTKHGISQKSFLETHIILLPCSDFTKLRDVDVVFTTQANHRMREVFTSPTQYFVISPSSGSQWTRSKSVVRLSLSSFKLYDDVAVGGTFDYLHTGHRMLLSTCLLSARKRLVIGVTGAPLLVKKSHKEYIQPFETRRRNVELYCRLQRPDLYLEPVELVEPAGPTATDPNFDLIVVSEETASGISAINDIRAKNGFKPMQGLIIHLAASYGKMKDLSQDSKLSSTTIRLRQKKVDAYLYGSNPHAVPPAHVQPDAQPLDL
jgi:phosphopantetheine adenylyltransferase